MRSGWPSCTDRGVAALISGPLPRYDLRHLTTRRSAGSARSQRRFVVDKKAKTPKKPKQAKAKPAAK
jgi:hypothetical protein